MSVMDFAIWRSYKPKALHATYLVDIARLWHEFCHEWEFDNDVPIETRRKIFTDWHFHQVEQHAKHCIRH